MFKNQLQSAVFVSPMQWSMRNSKINTKLFMYLITS